MSTPSWLGSHGAQPVLHPSAARWPNYPALIQALLNDVRHLPDGLGETILNPAEAAKIRACGISARANRTWRCPLLPDELVRYSILSHLSDAIPPESRIGPWHPKRAAIRCVHPIDPLGLVERRMLASLRRAPGYRRRKVALQRCQSKISAKIFHHTLDRLLRARLVIEVDGWLYPREDYESIQRAAQEARERRLRPISVTY